MRCLLLLHVGERGCRRVSSWKRATGPQQTTTQQAIASSRPATKQRKHHTTDAQSTSAQATLSMGGTRQRTTHKKIKRKSVAKDLSRSSDRAPGKPQHVDQVARRSHEARSRMRSHRYQEPDAAGPGGRGGQGGQMVPLHLAMMRALWIWRTHEMRLVASCNQVA